VITQYAELIMKNEEIDREQLIDKLICGGYVRTTIVEEPGDFSVRGGIMDIFSPLYGIVTGIWAIKSLRLLRYP